MRNIPALVRQLQSSRRTEQLRAAEAVVGLCEEAAADPDAVCEGLAAAGAVPPLVQLLRARSLALQANAAASLFYIASANDGLCTQVSQAAASSGAIPALVAALKGRSSERLQAVARFGAAGLLGFLAHLPSCLPGMLAAGVVPAVLQLCADVARCDPAPSVEETVLGVLCGLACQPASCPAVAAAEPVQALTRALQVCVSTHGSSGGGSGAPVPLLPADATLALAVVMKQRPELAPAAAAAGAPAALVQLLGCCQDLKTALRCLGRWPPCAPAARRMPSQRLAGSPPLLNASAAAAAAAAAAATRTMAGVPRAMPQWGLQPARAPTSRFALRQQPAPYPRCSSWPPGWQPTMSGATQLRPCRASQQRRRRRLVASAEAHQQQPTRSAAAANPRSSARRAPAPPPAAVPRAACAAAAAATWCSTAARPAAAHTGASTGPSAGACRRSGRQCAGAAAEVRQRRCRQLAAPDQFARPSTTFSLGSCCATSCLL